MSVDRDPAQLHVPVLLNECLDMLAPTIEAPGAVLIDATLGMGGHTEAALTRFPPAHRFRYRSRSFGDRPRIEAP